MTTHLADVREMDAVERGKELLAELRKLVCQREYILARGEKRMAALTAEITAQTSPVEAEIAVAEAELTGLILANRARFHKPRTVKCPDGSFGLRDSTRVEVLNEEILLDALMDRGYDDCMRVTRSILKEKLRARLEPSIDGTGTPQPGEEIPGCALRPGEIAHYTVAKALVEEARKHAQD